MTVGEFRDRVIADGIAEVEATYAADEPKRTGALDGFALCRSLDTREAFDRVLRARERREMRMVAASHAHGGRRYGKTKTIDDYWRHRYATLQVEWVLSCLIVAAWGQPGDTVSGRAARKVAEVLGA